MKLAELYSLASASKLDKPYIKQEFFPFSCDKYIIFQNGGGNNNFPAKNYDYFNDTISLIKPFLEKENIQIVQIGLGEEKPLNGVVDLRGKTSIAQANYLISKCLLFCGNDSVFGHVAGILNIPSVLLFGPTLISAHSPYWLHNKTILLDSHRNGKAPSCNSQESGAGKMVNYIKPELVAESILNILQIPHDKFPETLYIGNLYGNHLIEVAPAHGEIINKDFALNMPLNYRLDYVEFNEDIEKTVFHNLTQRPFSILSKNPLNIDILKRLKNHVPLFIYDVGENYNLEFMISMTKSGIPFQCISYESEDWLKKVKLEYYEHGLIIKKDRPTLEQFHSNCAHYNNISEEEFKQNYLNKKLYKQSTKALIYKGQLYSSYLDFKNEKTVSNIGEITPFDAANPESLEEQEFIKVIAE